KCPAQSAAHKNDQRRWRARAGAARRRARDRLGKQQSWTDERASERDKHHRHFGRRATQPGASRRWDHFAMGQHWVVCSVRCGQRDRGRTWLQPRNRWWKGTLQSDGVLVAWGNNQYGQTNIPANLSNVVSIESG